MLLCIHHAHKVQQEASAARVGFVPRSAARCPTTMVCGRTVKQETAGAVANLLLSPNTCLCHTMAAGCADAP